MKQIREVIYNRDKYYTEVVFTPHLANPHPTPEIRDHLMAHLQVQFDHKGHAIPVSFATPQDKLDFVNHYIAHYL